MLALFNRFYSAYPKKVDKQAALKAWKKLKPSIEMTDSLIADVRMRIEQGEWCTGPNKQYIPGPAPYLNGRKWENEIIPRPDYRPTPEQQAKKTAQMLSEMDKEKSWIQ